MTIAWLWCLVSVAQADEEKDRSRAVGGSLAGWGAVPVASEEERTEGLTHLWGQLQVWATVLDQDVDPQADPASYGDPEADAGFSIFRARLGLDGFVPMGNTKGAHQVDYALAVGVAAPYDAIEASEVSANADVQLVDAFGRWALPTGLGVTSLAVGHQRVPFSREAMMSSAHLVFQEGAVSSAWLAPSRDEGAVASQSVAFGDGEEGAQILLRAGAFEGTTDLFGASGPSLLAVGRLEFILGDTYRTWSAEKQPALGVGVAGLRDSDPATSTTSVEADLLARYSLVTLMGEVVTSSIAPTDTTVQPPGVVDATGRFGYLGQLSVFLPVKGPQGVEVAGRWSSFDDATGVDTTGDVSILHAGATWRSLLPRTDLGAGYVHRTEKVSEVPNDTVRLWVQVRPEGRF